MNSTCIKRTLSLFLVLAFFIGTLVFVPVTANAGDNEDWEYYIEDGEVTITGYNGSDTDVTIPSEIDGYPVTEIGDWAFEYCSLTSVTIPDSVMRIGEGAFWGCDSLESVTIPDSVTNIDDEALSFCTALVSINVSDGNPFYKSVDGVLYDKDLTELICCPGGKTNVDIPDSVTSIGDYALKNCYSLTSVTIPDSVTSIGAYAFDGCSVLGSVTIPYSVTSIGEWAFSGCSSLTSVTIPDSVTSLGEYAFSGCRSLTSVTIPDSVTSIGEWALNNCYSLTSVTIPDSVTSIGDYAFYGCTSITNVTVPDSVTSIGDNAFDDTALINNDANYENGVLYVGNHLIKAKESIFGSYAIKEGTLCIAGPAFSGCTGLTSVTIPDSVTSIGRYAFLDCTSLTSVTIPDSVTSIGYWAFENTVLTNNDTNYDNGVLYVGNHLIKANTSFYGSYEIREGTLCIAGGAFENCTSLTSVTIPDSVTSIGYGAFRNCSGLASVMIPDSVTSIEDLAFAGCAGLTSVTIGNSVKSIGYGAFDNCTSLTSAVIPDGVTEIGYHAFGWYRQSERYSWQISDFIIYGYDGTVAQDYAKENGFEFVAIVSHEHKYTETVTAPTCTMQGYIKHTCSRCGDSYVDTYVDALGHDFGADGNAEKCSRCGEKNPDYKPPVNFKDVKPGAYYADAVAWAVAKGVTTGTSATTFSPNDGCTRGQVVAFLWRAAGSPEPRGNKNPFSDVKSNAYYYKAVLWAVENEVTSGTDATHFSPNSVCTRGQIVTFLWRANGKPAPAKTANPFKDVKASDYYYDAVLWAVEKDITLGTDAAHFSPSATCTRGQVVAFLYRAMV